MLPRAVLIAALLSSTPALAFDTQKLGQWGSLSLSDLAALIGKTPKLKAEIDQALAALKTDADAVKCTGRRFPGPWAELGGLRVAPYSCRFADTKWLSIRATVRVSDKKGRAFDEPSPQAMKRAVNVSETDLRWTWTAKDPDE